MTDIKHLKLYFLPWIQLTVSRIPNKMILLFLRIDAKRPICSLLLKNLKAKNK